MYRLFITAVSFLIFNCKCNESRNFCFESVKKVFFIRSFESAHFDSLYTHTKVTSSGHEKRTVYCGTAGESLVEEKTVVAEVGQFDA